MAHIARESSSPIRDGDNIIAADVENEFDKIFTEQNALLDTTNLARAANVVSGQFANTTITGDKFTDDTITLGSMEASATALAVFSIKNISGTLTDSATLVDMPDVTSLTLTPGSTSDIVTMSLFVSVRQNAAKTLHNFGFNIDDGTGDVECGALDFRYSSSTTMNQCRLFQHTMTATAAAATVYIARYKRSDIVGSVYPKWQDTVGAVDYNAIFYVTSTPIK